MEKTSRWRLISRVSGTLFFWSLFGYGYLVWKTKEPFGLHSLFILGSLVFALPWVYGFHQAKEEESRPETAWWSVTCAVSGFAGFWCGILYFLISWKVNSIQGWQAFLVIPGLALTALTYYSWDKAEFQFGRKPKNQALKKRKGGGIKFVSRR